MTSLGDELAAYAAVAAESAWTPRRPRRVVRAAAVAAAACLIGAGAFVVGEHHHPPGMTVLTGVATVGGDELSVTVAGWTYGLQGLDGVTWTDSQGQMHMGGRPACLGGPGTTAAIRFGEVPVTLPDGTMIRQIVWVGC